MKKIPVLTVIESLGIITLCLVVLGLTQAPWEYIGAQSSVVSLILQGLMALLVGVSIIRSLLKVAGASVRPSGVYGTALLIIGGVMFFVFPSFFTIAYAAPWPHFWILVSYYSLPAIMIEGGLFTIFDALMRTRGAFVSPRERTASMTLIILYLICAVSANFLALTGALSIEHQIWFSRGVVLTMIALLLLLWKKTSKTV
jgi:hypothetical protein